MRCVPLLGVLVRPEVTHPVRPLPLLGVLVRPEVTHPVCLRRRGRRAAPRGCRLRAYASTKAGVGIQYREGRGHRYEYSKGQEPDAVEFVSSRVQLDYYE